LFRQICWQIVNSLHGVTHRVDQFVRYPETAARRVAIISAFAMCREGNGERSYAKYRSDNSLQKCNKSRVISCGFCPRRCSNLTPGDFYLGLISRDEVYKSNPHTPEELSNVRLEISTVSREKLQSVNSSVFHRCTSSFGQEGNIFSVFYCTGEFLLDFLQIAVILCVAADTCCYPPGLLI
jgi:hypothetical protein